MNLAFFLSSSRGTTESAENSVADKMTGGATPASMASFQRLAQRHQWLPGFSPGNPDSGTGVLRSLPAVLEKAKNSAVISAQITCFPRSSGSVSHVPFLNQPAIGSHPHSTKGLPRTFLFLIMPIFSWLCTCLFHYLSVLLGLSIVNKGKSDQRPNL